MVESCKMRGYGGNRDRDTESIGLLDSEWKQFLRDDMVQSMVGYLHSPTPHLLWGTSPSWIGCNRTLKNGVVIGRRGK